MGMKTHSDEKKSKEKKQKDPCNYHPLSIIKMN